MSLEYDFRAHLKSVVDAELLRREIEERQARRKKIAIFATVAVIAIAVATYILVPH